LELGRHDRDRSGAVLEHTEGNTAEAEVSETARTAGTEHDEAGCFDTFEFDDRGGWPTLRDDDPGRDTRGPKRRCPLATLTLEVRVFAALLLGVLALVDMHSHDLAIERVGERNGPGDRRSTTG
jgi:hypothetical protein